MKNLMKKYLSCFLTFSMVLTVLLAGNPGCTFPASGADNTQPGIEVPGNGEELGDEPGIAPQSDDEPIKAIPT